MAYTFTKNERLCSFNEINSLVKDGAVLFHYPFRVVYQIKEDQQATKILISVPKKNFKRAVHRNLLKRRVRESYRKNKELLHLAEEKCANIMFVYVAKEILEYRYIETKLKDILGKISKAVEEAR
jgi:ribonuclease P protein component